MKLKSLFVATVAVAGLASCSSDKIGQDGGVTGSNDIEVSVSVQTAATRGAIEEGVGDSPSSSINNVVAYVMKGDKQVGKMDLAKSGSNFNGTFQNLTLNGTERVVISANNYTGQDVITPQGYNILDVQSSKADGKAKRVAAIYYFDSASLSEAVKTDGENKRIYTLDKMVLKPQASRAEVSGTIDFEEKLVKSVDVTEITPNNYSETFGATERFFAQSTGNAVNVTEDKAKATLGKLANVGFYDKVKKENTLVVANHLFNGDEKRIAFRMNAIIYDVVKDATGKRVKPVDKSNTVVDSYVYKSEDLSALYIKVGTEYFALTEKNDGKLQINGKKYNKADAAAVAGLELSTYSTVENGTGYFNLVNFAEMLAGDIIDKNASKEYVQGRIYKVFFNKIDWNGDGVVDGNDKYNPDTNGEGGTTPSASDADVTVGASIMEWKVENTGSSVE